MRVLKKYITSSISYKYNKFKKLFKKELDKKVLPKY
jgi:hypothetical protein